MRINAMVFILILWLIPSDLSHEEIPTISKDIPSSTYEPYWTSPRLFIVENIASMRLRVYDRPCSFEEDCDSFLLLDAPVVVGKDDPERRSILGSFEIHRWKKFYVDGKGEFVPWNRGVIPKANSKRGDWGKQGAFGWYAMILVPDAGGQWIHGTIGWGEDKEGFILPSVENGAMIRQKSRGCTRVSNEVIAILRNYLPENTPVIKIYAKENSAEDISSRGVLENKTWDYVLSKGRDQTSYPLERFDLEDSQVYERGTLRYSSIPRTYPVRAKTDWVRGELNGNPYEIKEHEFKGVFWVDTGKLEGYEHPKRLRKNNRPLPSFLVK